MVGSSADGAETDPDHRLGAAPPRALGAEAALQTGLAQGAQVPAHHLTEVGPQHEIDDRVVDCRGLGKHRWHGERQRRDVLNVSKGSPHRYHSVRAPRRKETNADSDTKLEKSKTQGQVKRNGN